MSQNGQKLSVTQLITPYVAIPGLYLMQQVRIQYLVIIGRVVALALLNRLVACDIIAIEVVPSADE